MILVDIAIGTEKIRSAVARIALNVVFVVIPEGWHKHFFNSKSLKIPFLSIQSLNFCLIPSVIIWTPFRVHSCNARKARPKTKLVNRFLCARPHSNINFGKKKVSATWLRWGLKLMRSGCLLNRVPYLTQNIVQAKTQEKLGGLQIFQLSERLLLHMEWKKWRCSRELRHHVLQSRPVTAMKNGIKQTWNSFCSKVTSALD